MRNFQTLISLNGLGWTRLGRTSGGLQHQRGAGADHGHHCRLLLLHLQRFFLLALLAESLAVALQVPQRFGLCVTPHIQRYIRNAEFSNPGLAPGKIRVAPVYGAAPGQTRDPG